jgi:hypothetical protein
MTKFELWARGLLASAITAGSTAGGNAMALMYADGAQFNLQAGLVPLLRVVAYTFALAFLGKILCVLRTSPLPGVHAGSNGLPQDHIHIVGAPPIPAIQNAA